MNKQVIHKCMLLPAIVLCICSSIEACTTAADITHTNPSSVTVSSGRIENSYATTRSIGELAKESTLIVIGEISKADVIVNLARDPNDHTKPDERIFIVGQVYQVEVRQILKGDSTKSIRVVQAESFIGIGEAKDDEAITRAKARYTFVPMVPKQECLMFLRSPESFAKEGYYAGVAEPWRFNLSNLKQIIPETPWEGASIYFPPQTMEGILDQIEHPDIPHPELLLTPPPQSPYP